MCCFACVSEMLAEAGHGVLEQDDSANSAVSHDNTDKVRTSVAVKQ